MNLHEYQAKTLLARHGVVVPKGEPVLSKEQGYATARRFSDTSPTGACVVKAQIHAGGRGKGGGVKICRSEQEAIAAVEALWHMQLITHQTGLEGKKVQRLLIEEGVAIARELYLSLLVDRTHQRVVLLSSPEGGMDIEEVAARSPEKITQTIIDPTVGLLGFQAQHVARSLGLQGASVRHCAKLLGSLYQAFVAEDCSLVEINPLVLTENDDVIALDAKLNIDDNALFRQKETHALRDSAEKEALELEADAAGLSYIKLDGQIGCMVNGAGLAMGTMDIIQAAGGQPANFLDIGGGADSTRVEKAFRIITADPNVKAILINIFGGIVRCDIVAEGVVAAFKAVSLNIPVVVRLEGTNAERARQIIAEAGLGQHLIAASNLKDAAEKSVTCAARSSAAS